MYRRKSVGCEKWRVSQSDGRLPRVSIFRDRTRSTQADQRVTSYLTILKFHLAKTSFSNCSDEEALVEAA